MFVIEGMKKVRKVIEEKRRRKLTKNKKVEHNNIANNTIIEIEKYEGKKGGDSPVKIQGLEKA